jgi:acetyl-CoA synthetase (ADP-forming)
METVKSARQLIEDAKTGRRRALDEATSKQILEGYGIRTPRSMVIRSDSEIDNALLHLSVPVVLKLISPDVLHKSDFGAVVLGLSDEKAIRIAIEDISRRCLNHGYQIDGFLLEETAGPGYELVIGGYKDDTFGPVIMFGLGGIFIEVLQDVAFRICPITEVDAREMLEELRGSALLRGARGGVSIPDRVLVDTLLAVGGERGMLMDLADTLKELDINPLLADGQGVTALDARIIFAED